MLFHQLISSNFAPKRVTYKDKSVIGQPWMGLSGENINKQEIDNSSNLDLVSH